MKLALKIAALSLTVLIASAGGTAAWYLHTKQPQRSGDVALSNLIAPVSVRYDERGVPHIWAENEADLYRTLGYVHAQDRLFQMEMVRRLAQGELAEVLGPKLVDTDRLFRTLGIRAHAQDAAARMNQQSPSSKALLAYLDGINQYQATHPAPLEFDLLKIPKRPFTPQDTLAVSGYLAYSFAAAFRTEPALSFVRDKLGAKYLKVFDLDWNPQGVIPADAPVSTAAALSPGDWQVLSQLAQLSRQALALAGVPAFEGSNAWAIAGSRTASGRPLLAGDPHIGYSLPSVWYEAHLAMPGFELYGHHQALTPTALLGHNAQFGWSLTMFQNDDLDLIAEKLNPENPNQVWHQGQWVFLQSRVETILVKGGEPVQLTLRRSPHGPLITDAFKDSLGKTPVAMWWAFLETENPILDAFYDLNRANTLEKARIAASQIHAPGLNVVWASASGDIGWWAAAKLPIRPEGVNPSFILDGTSAAADKLGFYRFSDNPQEENPPRGYIVSANHQPKPKSGVPVAGYYNLADRAQRLDERLRDDTVLWDSRASQDLQLDTRTGYGPRVLAPLLPILNSFITVPMERAMLESLAGWDGSYELSSITPTVFNQLLYELTRAAFADEMGEVQFNNLLGTRALDSALPRLAEDANSPWWDNTSTPALEGRTDTVKLAWRATIDHLQNTLGKEATDWGWGNSHTLTHSHPLAAQKPLNWLFNVGPFPAPGGHEVPNNLSSPLGPAPWAVSYGPSTRRVIDFGAPGESVGINPVGQSGVLFDKHYSDQALSFVAGGYLSQRLSAVDVAAHTRSTLTLSPPANAPKAVPVN
ncbi:MAG: penicillin acylase family protein [Gammaproteobacteria bacterium]|nr:penicillin acylase family protein [Gammaproteobacteria bacterium]MBU3996575.1 penicillin acylase family protein [Gammaproteobacteria bacterium]MBU4079439.1 penicillin acylase family protein [Gammaproteobacteria bacterium]MBU4173211.1 penicillin acylase family protein [Gammaproteobacteria bacterium]